MLPGDAVRLVERLRRCYPLDVLEPESADAYVRHVAQLGDRDVAKDAMLELVRHAPRLPSIAEIRGAYQGRLRRVELSRERAEFEALPRQPLPVEARELLDRLTRPLLHAGRVEGVSVEVVETADGECEDCGRLGGRVTFGESGRALCHDCAQKRLAVREHLERGEEPS